MHQQYPPAELSSGSAFHGVDGVSGRSDRLPAGVLRQGNLTSTTTAPHSSTPPTKQPNATSRYIEGAVRVYLMRDLAGIERRVIAPASFGSSLPAGETATTVRRRCSLSSGGG